MPEAAAQSADAKAASGSAGGTTVSIQVYRSSFPITKWDLNDDDFSLTKAEWPGKPADDALPQRGTPGQAIEWPEAGMPSGYAEPTRAGFEFAGWSTDKSASAGGFIDGTGPKLSMPDGAPDGGKYTLYALWTPLEYSVIFDLAKNPDANGVDGATETDASFALNWDSKDDVRTVTPLGGGRFRVDGFTMNGDDYDAATRTVCLPKPGRTGYDFLGWAEPDGQNLAIDNAAKDGYAMNPVRLTQIDGTPVLTARWSATVGVDVPLSVTFGDYDRTGAPGNPSLGSSSSSAASDTTQSEADDVETEGLNDQDRYEAAGQACLKNTSWHEAVKVVGMRSERSPDASQVLVSYDTAQASNEEVLGGTDKAGVEHEGERLLSIYPSAAVPADKSSGIHLRLSDQAGEDALGDAFSMGAKGSGTETKDISYGLNLSTDPVTGAANHGLVLETQDYERKQIATVSYTFAVGEATTTDPMPEAFWTYDDNGRTMGVKKIKQEALAVAAGDQAAIDKYTRWMNDDHRFYIRWFDKGVAEDSAFSSDDWTVYDVRIIGVNHDDRSDATGKAGLTFQFVDLLNAPAYMNSATNTNAGGWASTSLRASLNGGVIWSQAPLSLRGSSFGGGTVVPVSKTYRNGGSQSGTRVTSVADAFFIASYAEMVSICQPGLNSVWSTLKNDGSSIYAWWQSQAINGTSEAGYLPIVKTLGADGVVCNYWTRSPMPSGSTNFVHIYRMYTPTDTSNRALSMEGICPAFCF